MSLNRRSTSGFTLIEVLIATAILAITITGVMSVVVETNRLNQHNQERKTAEKRASGMLENIKKIANNEKELIDFLDNNQTFAVEGLSPVQGRNNVGEISYEINSKPGAKSIAVKVYVILRWNGIMGPNQFSLTKILSVNKSSTS